MSTYKRLPVAFDRGEGAWLWDTQGRRYLDALSGIAVCGLGHAHPQIADALADQARTLLHTSNLYGIPLQTELASRLTALAQMENVFFCNSGAEANEAAIKITRLHARAKDVAEPTVIVAQGSFHGRTMATLSATGNPKVQAGFEPLLMGFEQVPYNDIDAMASAVAQRPGVVAIMVEPIQGEGGVRIPDVDYLRTVRELCDSSGCLMVLDEVQTGMCRTGEWFAYQHSGVLPDVMTLAKSLGNGVPIGACLARGKAAQILQPGTHASTFGGNPLACRAALTVLDVMERDELAARATRIGERLVDGFRSSLADCSAVKDIRGKGLMIGIELNKPCTELVGRALEAGLLINVAADTVVRLLPPLIIDDEQLGVLAEGVTRLVRDFE